MRNGELINIVSYNVLGFLLPSVRVGADLIFPFFVFQVGFVRDPEHAKLGDHTGPWSEPRPASEMMEDFDQFNDECKTLLRVSLPLSFDTYMYRSDTDRALERNRLLKIRQSGESSNCR